MKKLLILFLSIFIIGCASTIVSHKEISYYKVSCFNYGQKIYEDILRKEITLKYVNSITYTSDIQWYKPEDNLKVIPPNDCVYIEQPSKYSKK